MNDVTVRFEEAKSKVIGIDRQRFGIGTYAEKSVHAIFKNFYEPDEDKQEIPIENYIADIYNGKEIIEIQTRQLNKMRNKLSAFLPLYPVTVVHPVPRDKWLLWIDEESGEISNKRKSPAHGTPYTAFFELYKIKMFLKDPNLKIRIAMMDVEEYRLLNGWSKDRKRGSSRFDRIPLRLVEEIVIEQPKDYLQFVPIELEDSFTVKEFAKASHIPQQLAGTVLHILNYVGVVERVGKKGKAYLYRAIE